MQIFLRNPPKNLNCNGGKFKFELLVIKFKFNFPAIALKIFLAGFIEKFAFNIKEPGFLPIYGQ